MGHFLYENDKNETRKYVDNFEYKSGTKLRRSITKQNQSVWQQNISTILQNSTFAVKNQSVSIPALLTKDRNGTLENNSRAGNDHDHLDPCIIYLTLQNVDRNISEKTKTKIETMVKQDFFLIYLHISPPKGLPETISPLVKNRLLEWQYIRKGDYLLNILPVDFDIVTFNMLEFLNEESNVELQPLSIQDENRTCDLKDDFTTIVNIYSYLWHLTHNTSNEFIICHQKFDDQEFKDVLYYFTTIWIGYDFLCYEPNLKSFKNPGVSSKTQSLLSPLLSFFLALEFIWIFKLIEIHEVQKAKDSDDLLAENDEKATKGKTITIQETSAGKITKRQFSASPKCSCYYFPDERPYGFHRFVKKIFHSKITPHRCKCDFHTSGINRKPVSKSVFTEIINLPSVRLILLLYIFILLPVAIYRTLGRKVLADREYGDYRHVVRASEPMCNSINNNDNIVLQCDWMFAVFGSLIGVVIFIFYHNNIFQNEYKMYSFALGYQTSQSVTVCDKLMARVGLLWDLICYISDQIGNIACWTCVKSSSAHRHQTVILKNTKKIRIFRSTKRRNCCLLVKCASILYLMLALVEFAVQLVFCFLPLIPFVTHHFMKTLSKRKFVDSFLAFIILILSIFSFRPIISSFLFVFRSVTIILFVVLPVREYIFKYFIYAVAVIIYLMQYYKEVMDLITSVLIYVCSLAKEKYGQTFIGQDVFNHILKNLGFVKTKIYFAIFKTIVVSSYIFITIETLTVGKDLGKLEFVDLTQYGLIFTSPYVLSILFHGGKNELNDENKIEIQKMFEKANRVDLRRAKFKMYHAFISKTLPECFTCKQNPKVPSTNVTETDSEAPLQTSIQP
ncbi:uncharacterized protein LOC133185941 [Saccostrea echinata]|uniref:uncharacterized protein LOC133185941 n=1 Tax=Saccostrea echinata TaxID=191078 RepID=UPI002A8076E0|nr:uncharacterized protein LOC133185941 [Saccostrea echinata]